MKKKLTIILALALVGAAIAMMYVFRPAAKDYAKSGADIVLSSTELYATYALDETTGDSLYIDKIIEVNGTAVAIERDSSSLSITLEGDGEGGVLCSFSNIPKDFSPEIGQDYTIKGKCTGFLMDVNMNFCSISE